MKDDRVYIGDIIDCIDRIDEYTQNDQFVFMNSTRVQDAVIRNLQTLSESTQKLSDKLKAEHPEINWKAISGFRNILVHNYLGLDLPQILVVIENRRPQLRGNLEKYCKPKIKAVFSKINANDLKLKEKINVK